MHSQSFIPARRRIGRQRKPAAATTPAAALNLVGATYDKDTPFVDLAFDRPIDIAAMDVTTVIVDDDTLTGSQYAGYESPALVSPTTVRVSLNHVGGAAQLGIHLTVGAGNGIVAVDDGGVWGGVTELELPWP